MIEGSSPSELKVKIERYYRVCSEHFRKAELEVNIEKTELMMIRGSAKEVVLESERIKYKKKPLFWDGTGQETK